MGANNTRSIIEVTFIWNNLKFSQEIIEKKREIGGKEELDFLGFKKAFYLKNHFFIFYLFIHDSDEIILLIF